MNNIIENINKTVGKLKTTKQRLLQGNGMAAISKTKARREGKTVRERERLVWCFVVDD